MGRGLVILGGVAVGVLLSFAIGLTTAQHIARGAGIDESEYIGIMVLGGCGAPLLGALVGGLVAARLSRR